jgi:nucleoid-associated protein YgaU
MAKHAWMLELAAVLLAALIVGCKTAPKAPEEAPEEAPEPVVIEQPSEPGPETKPETKPEEKAEEKPAVSPVSDEEVRQARSAIARAREADAEYYEPALLRQAEEALEAALRARNSDPAGARELLAEAKARAGQAFDGAVAKAAADLESRLARMKEALLEEKADRFLPEEYQRAVAGIPEVQRLYVAGELVDAREKAYSTLAEMSGLLERLRERKRWVETLKRDINQNLKQAEELGAYTRAPEAFARANRLYLQGIDEYQGFQLDSSEETLAQAKEAAQEAIRLASGRRQEEKEQTRILMLEVMRLLEEASSLTVVADDGTVIAPEPWSGEPYLPEEVEQTPDDQSLLLRAGRTAVLADVAEENLLEQAKQLWQQGVREWQGGNYGMAEEYFHEARRLAEAYKAQAVDSEYPVYVVRLIPERRDCLWRIAEYNFIYGNPYLWPKIWRRNRKLIQHPDLIYPGWKLVIPPR